MPSQALLDALSYQCEVNRLLEEVGFEERPLLSRKGMSVLDVAIRTEVSTREFVATVLMEPDLLAQMARVRYLERKEREEREADVAAQHEMAIVAEMTCWMGA